MELSVDLLRNIPNFTRLGGSKVPIVAPAAGRPMEAAMIEFIGWLSSFYFTTAFERSNTKPNATPKRRPGQRFDLDAWLRSSAVLLKLKQAELSCKPRGKVALVNKYLERPQAGRFQDVQGVNPEHLKEWRRKKDSLRFNIWTKSCVKILLSFFIPEDFQSRDVKDQRHHLESVRVWAENYFSTYLESEFPVEFFTLFLDFSQHSDDQIKRLVSSLEATKLQSEEQRYAQLATVLQPAIESLVDLVGDLDEVPHQIKI